MRGTRLNIWTLFFCLLTVGLGTSVYAQRPGQPDTDRFLPNLDEAAAREALEEFRQQRLSGDFSFRFQLEHRPRRGDAQSFRGRMWGTWKVFDPLIRVHIEEGVSAGAPNRFLLQSGEQASFWVTRDADEPEALSGERMHTPLLPGITFTPFDLAMPFSHWKEATYIGRDRIANRPAYVFYLRPGAEQLDTRPAGVDGVRLSLFADHNVLLRAETVDANGVAIKSFKVRSFQEVNGQYIVRKIDLLDEQSREKTRFEVDAAAVGILLPDTVFEPAALSQPLSVPSTDLFERL
ncbi:MAG: outer membrane lipoprotein-sorting protein [Opitutales bacterium]